MFTSLLRIRARANLKQQTDCRKEKKEKRRPLLICSGVHDSYVLIRFFFNPGGAWGWKNKERTDTKTGNRQGKKGYMGRDRKSAESSATNVQCKAGTLTKLANGLKLQSNLISFYRECPLPSHCGNNVEKMYTYLCIYYVHMSECLWNKKELTPTENINYYRTSFQSFRVLVAFQEKVKQNSLINL